LLVRTELQSIPADIFPSVTESIEKSIDKIMPGVNKTRVETTDRSVTYQLDSASVARELSTRLFEAGFQTITEGENRMLVRVTVADWIEEVLREKLPDNPFVIQKEDKVGPKIGEELKQDSIIAVFFALL
jgi:preprotein translocase subunit SecF